MRGELLSCDDDGVLNDLLDAVYEEHEDCAPVEHPPRDEQEEYQKQADEELERIAHHQREDGDRNNGECEGHQDLSGLGVAWCRWLKGRRTTHCSHLNNKYREYDDIRGRIDGII